MHLLNQWNFGNGSTYRRLYKIIHCKKIFMVYFCVCVRVFLSYYLLLFEFGTTLKKNMIRCKYECVDLNYKIIQFSDLFFFLALVFIKNLFAFRLSIIQLFHSFFRKFNEFRRAFFSSIYIFIWKRENSLWIIALYKVCMHLWTNSW